MKIKNGLKNIQTAGHNGARAVKIRPRKLLIIGPDSYLWQIPLPPSAPCFRRSEYVDKRSNLENLTAPLSRVSSEEKYDGIGRNPAPR